MLDQSSKADVHPANADGIFKSVKAFSQSDGRWRYSSNNPESSAFAAGIALETLAGVVSLAFSELDQSLISTLNNDISKLFDSIEKHGTLATTSSVVRGLAAFAAVSDGSVILRWESSLILPGNKILGLANFFLGIGVPGDAKDLLNQIDSLTCLESNRVSIPLILSLPATVLSLTKKDSIQVKVNTVLGSNAPPLTVKLVGAFTSGSKEASLVENQELVFDAGTRLHNLNNLTKSIDVGSYTFVFEIVLHKPEDEKVYVTEGPKKVPIFVSGLIKIENAEVAILDSDLGRIETQKKLDVAGQCAVSLSANHLQKLRVSFKLTTPHGLAFKPHQALLKLRHESKVEHIFVVGNSGEQFEIVLNFLGVVEKFFSLSGRYDIELTVGDVVMENSLLRAIGHIGLDVPEPPEKAPRPPPQPVDPYSRYGPKEEITHIFRAPEKRPKKELSFAFLGLSFLPLLGLSIGLSRLGVNLKNFPSTDTVAATFAIFFHVGIGAVLILCVFLVEGNSTCLVKRLYQNSMLASEA
ncbi:dolichyl-diphosphooligosaccharide--protein glycosyltransferase subunit 2-like [Hibiscus syriacus]|uniref:dolichyl-diphosphooligosaccharide--protein glycosyltransferase subunit 2-like n=1 Tax=Hibiscus syriacus TaxID=106335 RepID=UPI0019248615|nr:dolichyl-diphosphooligosaccharide--protein glycosyltransferase subunit 2-like [Hibiscus syriacus]